MNEIEALRAAVSALAERVSSLERAQAAVPHPAPAQHNSNQSGGAKIQASVCQLKKSGNWGVKIVGQNPNPGDVVNVTTLKGKSWPSKITEQSSKFQDRATGDWITMWEVEPRDGGSSPKKHTAPVQAPVQAPVEAPNESSNEPEQEQDQCPF